MRMTHLCVCSVCLQVGEYWHTPYWESTLVRQQERFSKSQVTCGHRVKVDSKSGVTCGHGVKVDSKSGVTCGHGVKVDSKSGVTCGHELK